MNDIPMILGGPIRMSDVANFVGSVVSAYFRNNASSAPTPTVESCAWNIDSTSHVEELHELLPSSFRLSVLPNLDHRLCQTLIPAFQSRGSDLLSSWHLSFYTRHGWAGHDNHLLATHRILAVDISGIADVVKGQIFHSPVRDVLIAINHINERHECRRFIPYYAWDHMDKLNQYLAQMVVEANARLSQSISSAAHRLISDLG